MVKVYCSVCRKRCKGDVLKIEEHYVHHKCFQCTKCHNNLKQGGFFIKDAKFYCPDDYQSEFGVRCEICQNYVEGEVVTVLGKTFHIQCFHCSICSRLFLSGEKATIIDNSYYCSSCASKLTTITTATNTIDNSTNDNEKLLFNHPPSLSSPISDYNKKSNKQFTINSNLNQNHNHITNKQSFPVHNNNNIKSYSSLNGQLSVQVNENDLTVSDLVKQKLEPSGLEPVTVDTLLSTTPGQTISAGSFTPSASERRICPPGVDYGRQYPISYLQLAEQGFTAIMSSDELIPVNQTNYLDRRSRSLARTVYSPTFSTQFKPHHHQPQQHHVSRLDATRSNNAVRSPTTTSIPLTSSSEIDTSKHLNGTLDNIYHQNENMIPLSVNTMNSHLVGSNTPASIIGRPKRDLYVRRRQLSPGSNSLGSGLMGYHRTSQQNSSTLPPALDTHRSTGRYSHRSTPNVNAKRGMIQLAESLCRPERTLSPPPSNSASICWSEARRLASYPNARLPDSNSLPAIERYDFPAPPSPAVVMIDKRREKRMTDTHTLNTESRNGTLRDGLTSSIDTNLLCEKDPELIAKLDRIDAEIETLKRLGESSGITTALIQELEASKLQKINAPDLDPISASRSPNANMEPNYKTRYERHGFASPSRDTRRDRRVGHSLSYRLEYSSTGGRSGTIPSFPSTPRPGYTSGLLYGRAVSLPRPFTGAENGDTLLENGVMSDQIPINTSGVHSSISTTIRTGPSGQSYGHMGDVLNGRDRTGESHLQDGIGSLATSALSMDGLIAGSGDDVTVTGPTSGYFLKSGTLAGLPSSVTGLRPVGLPSHHQKVFSTKCRSRTSTPMPGIGGGGGLSTGAGYLTDSDMFDVDTYPSVQSWLKPSGPSKSFKVYSYELLKSSAGKSIKGLDQTHLEYYLAPDEFEHIFNMSRHNFERLPEWKRNDLKKKVNLL